MEMLEVGADRVGALPRDVGHDPALVVGLGLPLRQRDGPFRAVADAGAKAVAEKVAHQPHLSVDDLQGAFGTVGEAQAAAGALLLVDCDDRACAHTIRVHCPRRPVCDVDQCRVP